MEFEADIKAGEKLVPILVRDMSITGCGADVIVRNDQTLHVIGAACLVQLPLGVVLPATVCYTSNDRLRVRIGLQFDRLLIVQLRKLIRVIDTMMWRN